MAKGYTYTLNNLDANTDYILYIFQSDWSGNSNREDTWDVTIGAVTEASGTVDQDSGTGATILRYAYNTGSETSITFKTTNGDQLHEYAFLNETIPEPSSLSLMGLALGGLCFLRRRQG